MKEKLKAFYDITFSRWLNSIALLVLICVIAVFALSVTFFYYKLTKKEIENNKQEIILRFENSTFKKSDSIYYKVNGNIIDSLVNFNNQLNSKVKKINELQSKLEDLDSKNGDLFKLFLTILGSVFAIVGFFGFKSINDTRQAAIDKAVFDAKEIATSKSKEIAELEAKKISGDIATSVAMKIARIESEISTKREVKIFFENDFEKMLTPRIDEYYRNREERLVTIENEIDKLTNPDAYLLENKKTVQMQKEIDALRIKYLEALSILEDIKVKIIKKR